MRQYLFHIACGSLLLLNACDVHELPMETEKILPMEVKVDLSYQTAMAPWHHKYDGKKLEEQHLGEAVPFMNPVGQMRYIVRTYPVTNQQTSAKHEQEVVLTKSLAGGYDNKLSLNLVPGNYKVMAWSDMVKDEANPRYYNANSFSEIRLSGKHVGNTEHKDAFAGSFDLVVSAESDNQVELKMNRPLARFEFVTTDIKEFLAEEMKNGALIGTLEDYKVVFSYVGFMPNTYSIFSDKPTDSSTNIYFESNLSQLSDSEASLGFDYVLVNDTESRVTLQIAVYNKKGERINTTPSITIPLQRSRNTVVRGGFLMSDSSGGIQIDPDYNGDHNLIIP